MCATHLGTTHPPARAEPVRGTGEEVDEGQLRFGGTAPSLLFIGYDKACRGVVRCGVLLFDPQFDGSGLEGVRPPLWLASRVVQARLMSVDVGAG